MTAESSISSRLITAIKENEEILGHLWERRLGANSVIVSMGRSDPFIQPTRLLLHDVVRVLEGEMPSAAPVPTLPELKHAAFFGLWRIQLCHGIEVFLAGEQVIREWAIERLAADGATKVEIFDKLNRVFHRLFRAYAHNYCDACRETLATATAIPRKES